MMQFHANYHTNCFKARIHCEIFLYEHYMQQVSGTFHEILSTFVKYFYLTLCISVPLRTFLIYKNIEFTEKRYLVKFDSIKVFVTLRQKQKKIKNTKTYLNETMFDNQE